MYLVLKTKPLAALQRAQEIQAIDPLTAYYTKMAAVMEGIAIPSRHPDIASLINKVMGDLEAAKPKLTLSGGDSDRFHVEAFALKVFAGADRLDRGGKRDDSTMKRFFAASQFFRVCLIACVLACPFARLFVCLFVCCSIDIVRKEEHVTNETSHSKIRSR